jgi:hypothetical protein
VITTKTRSTKPEFGRMLDAGRQEDEIVLATVVL